MSELDDLIVAKSAAIDNLCNELDAKGDDLSNEDLGRLKEATADLERLTAGKRMGDAKAFIYQFSSSRSGPGSPEVRDGIHAGLSFTREQLGDLQRGALDRRITSKAAVTSATAGMAGVPGYDLINVFPWLRDKQRILDLIPQQRTDAPAVHYFQGTTAASAATAVAEGASKPESTPAWTEATATIRKLAHYTRVNDEVIADYAAFLDVIGTEMLSGLIDRENSQLLTGTGVAPNIGGLLTDPNVLTVGSAGTDIDAIADAWRSLRTGPAHTDPDVVVMHPNDWYSGGFLLAKDTAGNYLLGDPVTAVKPMLWGVPVIVTEAITENTAMVANLKLAATAHIRQQPTVEVAPYGGGSAEFIANQTLIRAEERLALAIHHPKAICLVTAV